MSEGEELPPEAPLLMQALRAVGYTTAAALADLVDNSIAAGAREVSILFSPVPRPVIAVLDDGIGMSGDELVAAMRFGSRDPRLQRSTGDLGRFGLGMKTASLSQCRRMTVVSLQDSRLSVARWDIDECERRGSWWLGRPPIEDVPDEYVDLLREQGRGTIVVWEELDRLSVTGREKGVSELDHVMSVAADHLAMAFHRFLAGDIAGPFDIKINGRSLPRLDPFLEGHARGQSLHAESFLVEGHEVQVSPFVLPFPSRLSREDLARTVGRESLRTSHGFYVYRGGRLVVPGGWFRIVPSDELVRLARVRVDVPVALDHLWKVDIRKTMAEPPAALRPELRRIVGAAANRSRKVYTWKGSKEESRDRIGIWAREELRDGLAAWRINRNHPLVQIGAAGGAGRLDTLLRVIEDGLPLHDIHLHISNDLPVAEPAVMSPDEMEQLARRIIEVFGDEPQAVAVLLDRLHEIDPFARAPEEARAIAERLRA